MEKKTSKNVKPIYRVLLCANNGKDEVVKESTSYVEAKNYILRSFWNYTLLDDENKCSDAVYFSAAVAHYEIYSNMQPTLCPLFTSPEFYTK